MRKFLSSIFSSDPAWPRDIPRPWLWSILGALILVAGAEALARAATAPMGPRLWQYWSSEAGRKYEWYRRLASAGETYRVVAVGDSLAARNFDPAAFTETSGSEAYNLGWPGMFPLAFDRVIPPMLEQGTPPEYVFLFQVPHSFVDNEGTRFNEAGVLDGLIGRKADGESLPGDYLALVRIYALRREVFGYWLRGQAPVTQPPLLGFMPLDAHNQAEFNSEDAGTVELDPNRLDVDRRFFDLAERRGFRIIVVLTPTVAEQPDSAESQFKPWVEAQAAARPDSLTVWDMTESDIVPVEHYEDNAHFLAEGAAEFSAVLGERFQRELAGEDGN